MWSYTDMEEDWLEDQPLHDYKNMDMDVTAYYIERGRKLRAQAMSHAMTSLGHAISNGAKSVYHFFADWMGALLHHGDHRGAH